MAKHRPHGCPWMFETGADVDMSAPILVVDPGAVGERGCNAHVQEVLGQIGDGFVARHIYRPRIPRHHRGGIGITGTPEPLRVVAADRGRQPKTGPQFVDRARLAVVEVRMTALARCAAGRENHTVATVSTMSGQPTSSPSGLVAWLALRVLAGWIGNTTGRMSAVVSAVAASTSPERTRWVAHQASTRTAPAARR